MLKLFRQIMLVIHNDTKISSMTNSIMPRNYHKILKQSNITKQEHVLLAYRYENDELTLSSTVTEQIRLQKALLKNLEKSCQIKDCKKMDPMHKILNYRPHCHVKTKFIHQYNHRTSFDQVRNIWVKCPRFHQKYILLYYNTQLFRYLHTICRCYTGF